MDGQPFVLILEYPSSHSTYAGLDSLKTRHVSDLSYYNKIIRDVR